MPATLENTYELFVEEAAQGDGESTQANNVQDVNPKE